MCAQCNEKISGRTDKKFCSDQCRFIFNNNKKQKSGVYKEVNEINKLLRKNRSILFGLNPDGTTHIKAASLIKLGFDFRYFTSYYKTKSANLYFLVYDVGYCYTSDDKIRIINLQEYMSVYTKNEVPNF